MTKSRLDSVCSGKKTRGSSVATQTLITYAWQLLEELHPMTLRQLHYAIFSSAVIEYTNDKASYMRLSRATTTARRAYRAWELDGGQGDPPDHSIPPVWMVDETRQAERVNVFENAQEYIEVVGRSYRRDNWQSQPHYCEIWSEKGTVLGSIRPGAGKWGVTTRVCHGYSSCGMEMEVSSLFQTLEKPITVFYLGDCDPSGENMETDIHRRVEAAGGVTFDMVRLAIHASDIAKFHLPPQKVKLTDSRAKSFKKRHGQNAQTVELDALPVEELRNRIDEAVSALVDRELWDRQIAVQRVELNCISEFAERMKNLPQLGASI